MRNAAAVAAVLICLATPAAAVSSAVKSACRSDYYTHCSGLAVGSSELRACMRKAGARLSKGCLKALVASNEVTEADVANYRAQTKRSGKAKAAD